MTPEDLVKAAEEGVDPPLPPADGIPKQWLPGWARWPIRVMFLPFVLLDLAAQRLVKFFIKPPWIRKGSCNRRGNCCHYIIMPEPKGLMTRLNYLWNTEVNGFYPRAQEPITIEGKKLMVMGCRYLNKDGSCAHYRLRPVICREWPRIEVFGRPQVLRGCGFRAIARNTANPYNNPSHQLNQIR